MHYYIIARRFNSAWRASFGVVKGTHVELMMYLSIKSLNVLGRYYNVMYKGHLLLIRMVLLIEHEQANTSGRLLYGYRFSCYSHQSSTQSGLLPSFLLPQSDILSPTPVTFRRQIPVLAKPAAEDDPVCILQPFLRPLLPFRLLFPLRALSCL